MNYFASGPRFWLLSLTVLLQACGNTDPGSNHQQTSSASVTILAQLNDTGIGFCADEAAVELACPQAAYPRQDGDLGRDALARQGELDKVGGGLHGFDWTKLANDGSPLVQQDVSWSEEGSEASSDRWSCLRDNVTSLLWEVKESDVDHPRFGGHKYTWYESDPNFNGGEIGFDDAGEGMCSTPPCNSQNYVAWVNEQGLCGFNDWRMPSVNELASIAVYSEVIPALDTHYFPNASQPRFFTKHSLASDPKLAWYVYFSDASVSFTNKSDPSHLRLVRGGIVDE